MPQIRNDKYRTLGNYVKTAITPKVIKLAINESRNPYEALVDMVNFTGAHHVRIRGTKGEDISKIVADYSRSSVTAPPDKEKMKLLVPLDEPNKHLIDSAINRWFT